MALEVEDGLWDIEDGREGLNDACSVVGCPNREVNMCHFFADDELSELMNVVVGQGGRDMLNTCMPFSGQINDHCMHLGERTLAMEMMWSRVEGSGRSDMDSLDVNMVVMEKQKKEKKTRWR